MPTLLAALPPQLKHLHARSSCTPATVRYTRVQKGGGAMGALQGAGRTLPRRIATMIAIH